MSYRYIDYGEASMLAEILHETPPSSKTVNDLKHHIMKAFNDGVDRKIADNYADYIIRTDLQGFTTDEKVRRGIATSIRLACEHCVSLKMELLSKESAPRRDK